MPLAIETFSNAVGGNAFYKAITHPLAAAPARDLVARLRAGGPVAIYDPSNLVPAFDALYPLDRVEIAGLYVQNLDHVGRVFRDVRARPVTELAGSRAGSVFVASFDGELSTRLRALHPTLSLLSFESLRLPDDMHSDRQRYLSNLNFATNFVFFRDADGHHTRLVTTNYWSNYGSKGGSIRFVLFDHGGKELAQWREDLPAANGAIIVDSAEIRGRFSLQAFTGQLFLHVIGAAGHDVVKYALDTYGDSPRICSCTHDANSWPADRYAGLPAPAEGEDVILWVQNSHPGPIPAGEIGLNLMGHDDVAFLQKPIAPFASYPLRVSELLPRAKWPQQVEIRAGKHFVRPRYEVVRADGRRNIAHPNVERSDLKLDENLPKLATVLGKGYILPAPILPPDRFDTIVLPTPMSTAQHHLPVKLLVYDANGRKVAEKSFGNLARKDSIAFDLRSVLGNKALESGYGHLELVYDFDAGSDVDGWMHALFRYVDRPSGHQAETSFGAHMFNMLATYKDEPQSYKGPPPGLTTRLFLRVGRAPHRTLCQLIYPASLPWHATSDTALILMSSVGQEISRRQVRIACGGSVLLYVDEVFDAAELSEAGRDCHVVVRDTTCRLFGYHGLVGEDAFSLDHMFGF
jgi:hypothetical protein